MGVPSWVTVKEAVVIVDGSMGWLKIAEIAAVTATFPLPSAGLVMKRVGGSPDAAPTEQPAARSRQPGSRISGSRLETEATLRLDARRVAVMRSTTSLEKSIARADISIHLVTGM